MVINSEFYWTIAIIAGATGIVGAISWGESRPRTSLNPRLIPTTPILYVAMLVGVLAFLHAMNLLGVHPPGNAGLTGP